MKTIFKKSVNKVLSRNTDHKIIESLIDLSLFTFFGFCVVVMIEDELSNF
ncbi:hypothetical protein [Flammeovirga kamogawensis]|uniref:RDD family protein n=1 Tax=Flammeovirga kamogawensis TaxID=373891 RepID=A0ABX8H0W1_9BACT|nr:hypothetical protein [Flammeovirga kamogawensis]MBB6459391.1 hypothetical protein [Flammeovirga kamogawensis]QWG08947.1 hypothetical protein KM029_08380 [Flammeovirga kamogawensis]